MGLRSLQRLLHAAPLLGVALTVPLVLTASCAAPDAPSTAEASAMPLFSDLGTLHRTITTTSPQAQQYFDQGLRLTYAFNHEEAINSFAEAARLDPDCAMCVWGIALALGPNINFPMDDSAIEPAFAAAQAATRLAGSATPVERALIDAMALRYAASNERRAALDSAYAGAMKTAAATFPNDPDVVTLHADAFMNLSPWNYWTGDNQARPGTGEVMATLEATVASNPDHPGACHFLIHLVEKPMPEKAVACAERLPALMPGAGHLVHMPAHIYMRVGRYADAVEANEHAAHADETYLEGRRPQGVYPLAYVPHNHHFLWAAASMAGNSAQAIASARQVIVKSPLEMVRMVPVLEFFLPTPYFALARFGRWEEVLGEPAPPAEFQYTTALWHYARGLALAANGDVAGAETEARALQAAAANVAEDQVVGINSARPIVEIAAHVLAGEIARKRGQLPEAIREFEAALRFEDSLLYDEPAAWYHPVRQILGAALLEAGLPVDAEAAYQEDLRRNPNNGWSLFGLAQAFRTQGKAKEAAAVDLAFRTAWAGADVTLTSSRF